MAIKQLPDAEYLRKVISYDPETGVLTWLPRPREAFKSQSAFVRWNKLHAGKPAFACGKPGNYKTGCLDGVHYIAHRVAYMYVHGTIGPGEIDHINGVRDDNRIANLRVVSRQVNTQNRKLRSDSRHGIQGVEFHVSKKWKAFINVNKKRVYLGLYNTFEEAAAVRKAAEVQYGFHPNHGRSS